jgi:pilus assembly protein Flp/PilA
MRQPNIDLSKSGMEGGRNLRINETVVAVLARNMRYNSPGKELDGWLPPVGLSPPQPSSSQQSPGTQLSCSFYFAHVQLGSARDELAEGPILLHIGTGESIMATFKQAIVSFLRREDGPTAVEYAVMLALIIITCLAAIATLGSNANLTFSTVGSAVGSAGS